MSTGIFYCVCIFCNIEKYFSKWPYRSLSSLCFYSGLFLLVDPFTRSVEPVVLATVVISQLSHTGINISKYFLLAQKRCEELLFPF